MKRSIPNPPESQSIVDQLAAILEAVSLEGVTVVDFNDAACDDVLTRICDSIMEKVCPPGGFLRAFRLIALHCQLTADYGPTLDGYLDLERLSKRIDAMPSTCKFYFFCFLASPQYSEAAGLQAASIAEYASALHDLDPTTYPSPRPDARGLTVVIIRNLDRYCTIAEKAWNEQLDPKLRRRLLVHELAKYLEKGSF